MKINTNIAIGHVKNYLIFVLLEDDASKRQEMMEKLNNKILKYII